MTMNLACLAECKTKELLCFSQAFFKVFFQDLNPSFTLIKLSWCKEPRRCCGCKSSESLPLNNTQHTLFIGFICTLFLKRSKCSLWKQAFLIVYLNCKNNLLKIVRLMRGLRVFKHLTFVLTLFIAKIDSLCGVILIH